MFFGKALKMEISDLHHAVDNTLGKHSNWRELFEQSTKRSPVSKAYISMQKRKKEQIKVAHFRWPPHKHTEGLMPRARNYNDSLKLS